MRPIDDPSFLTPDERLSEVASILAAGVLRLHARAAIPGDDLELARHEGDSPIFVGRKWDSPRIPAQPALRFPRKPCSVSIVVNGSRDPKTRREAWK
jgi:hypothetical protein